MIFTITRTVDLLLPRLSAGLVDVHVGEECVSSLSDNTQLRSSLSDKTIVAENQTEEGDLWF